MRSTFTILFLFYFLGVLGQAGNLLPTFGSGGIVKTNLGGINLESTSLVVQQDGKIVMAGHSYPNNVHIINLVRYNKDGSLDINFGSSGIVSTDVPFTQFEQAIDIALQSDGKFIIAATSGKGSGIQTFVLRYNSNGTLDNSFDGDGIANIKIGNYLDFPTTIKVQNDGRILVAGAAFDTMKRDAFIVRFNTDGGLDNSFAQAGKLLISFGSTSSEIRGMEIQSDGKIITIASNIIARFNPNGTLDNTFDSDGKLTAELRPNGSGILENILIQPDGKIVASGILSGNYVVVRYNTDGSLDNSFNNTGVVALEFNTVSNLRDLSLQTDGKIVVLGDLDFGINDVVLYRYLSNGSLDLGFGNNGRTTISISPGSDKPRKIISWQDRIYVGGYMDKNFLLLAFQQNNSPFVQGPYIYNGSAQPLTLSNQDPNCYLLTPPFIYQSGSVWSNSQVDLTKTFEIYTRLYFGGADNGADGLAFVLQTQGPNVVGQAGGGIGYGQIPGPSFVIEFDTYQNTDWWFNMSDPVEDHLAFMSNGSTNHNPAGGTALAPPYTLSTIENGQFINVRFLWSADAKNMSVFFMGKNYSYQGDIVKNIFGGNPFVTWGFTAATGSPFPNVSQSQHAVCIISTKTNLQQRAAMQRLITRVQPNPSGGSFELQVADNISGNAAIVITNSVGTVIEKRMLQLNSGIKYYKFDLKRNPPGLYLVTITTAVGQYTEKIIIQ